MSFDDVQVLLIPCNSPFNDPRILSIPLQPPLQWHSSSVKILLVTMTPKFYQCPKYRSCKWSSSFQCFKFRINSNAFSFKSWDLLFFSIIGYSALIETKNGVAQECKDWNPKVLVIHKFGYVLNLSVSDFIDKAKPMKNVFNTGKKLWNVFKNLPQILRITKGIRK